MSKELDSAPSSPIAEKRPRRPQRQPSLQPQGSGNPLLSLSRRGSSAPGTPSHEKAEAGAMRHFDGSAADDDSMLPPPAVAFIPPNTSSKLKVTWAKLKRRIGNGSAPSESLGDPTTTTESDGGSSYGAAARRNGVIGEKQDENEEVDEVVVEQTDEYDCWKKTTIPSNSASNRGAGGTGTTPGTGTGPIGTMPSDASSLRPTAYEANGPIDAIVGFTRYRIWPIVSRFFAPTYHDPAVEEAFQKEQWYNNKSLHIFGSFYLTLNWVLTISLLPHPWTTWNKVQLYGLGPALTVPLVVFAAFDMPRRQPWIWQFFVFASIWITAAANPIDMYNCGFYTSHPQCGNKDYMATFLYTAAAPTIALFALGQKRLLTTIFCLGWLVLVAIIILPIRGSFARNVVTTLLFQAFIIFAHYMREMADRRMYTMRAELKISYKAKQRAQINERKMMDAKRRFSSYIFHEVRVPLNTALLAVQNLKGIGVFSQDSEYGVEYQALEGSLQMMSQVLNDVLDFSRMERGGFSSVSRPFSLHNVMNSIFVPLRLDAAARGLTLHTNLDPLIDRLATQAAFPEEDIDASEVREGDGRCMGDEMRLRQVVGNLVSNACKFTPRAGEITITTELIYPLQEYHTPQNLPTAAELAGLDTDASDKTDETYSPRLSANRLQQHEAKTSPQPKELMIVRITVTDTGVGIKKSDMAENRLFSPYVQTAAGREQGGKGTGLGLSLVRQIVMLSGGRLGVRSQYGKGTSMYVELPYVIGGCTREGATETFTGGHRRTDTNGGSTIVDSKDKDKYDLGSPITPGNDSSTASDYRFVASLRKRSSDPTLDSIDETRTRNGSESRPRDSSVSTQLSVPLAYRYPSPQTSPALGNEPASPLALHVQGPSPPSTSPGPSTSSSYASPTSPASSNAYPPYPPGTSSPPVFHHPFALVPPSRPENRSHVSSVSAPAEVTLPPHLGSPGSPTSPVVSPLPSLPSASPSLPKASGSGGASSTALDFPDGPLRVLVVDDDALTRRLMSRMMLRLGCLVSTAENGKIALDMLLAPPEGEETEGGEPKDEVDAAEKGLVKQKKTRKVGMDPTAGIDAHKNYDITFLDNQMPVCSGVQVVAKLRSLGRDDLVVGVTANALLSDQEQYLESGASFILTKPVKEADLKKYLLVADKRRSEAKDPEMRRQRHAMSVLSGPSFPPPQSIHGPDED
ncbi:hypothetical protein JCM8097_008002 [Rhodosporidiobolus ruineniae]